MHALRGSKPAMSWTRSSLALALGAGIVGVSTLLAAQNSLAYALLGRPVAYWRLWLGELPLWLGWGLFVPLIYTLGARTQQRRLGARLLAHLGLGLAAYLFVFGLCMGVRALWGEGTAESPPLAFEFVRGAGTHAIIYSALVAASLAHHRSQAAKRAQALELELTRTREAQLRARLRPHFLFNTLNTIAALIRRQPSAALEVLEDLAVLLRRSLDAGPDWSYVDEEIDFCRRYLAIQARRFGPRLVVKIELEPGVGALQIPPLLLQPLIENVVVHAVAKLREAVTLELRARLVEGPSPHLEIEILDDGPGRPARASERLGLGSVRARLALLYRGEAQLQLGPARDLLLRPGLHVRLLLPAAPPCVP